MALSDCIKCWDTPCSCGWEYKDYGKENLSKHLAEITQYRSKEESKQIIERAKQIVDEMSNWHGCSVEQKAEKCIVDLTESEEIINKYLKK